MLPLRQQILHNHLAVIDGSISECDSFLQDCPAGEKCVPYASSGGTWDHNKCVPVTGDLGEGEACVSEGPVFATDDCDAATTCWDMREIDGAWRIAEDMWHRPAVGSR